MSAMLPMPRYIEPPKRSRAQTADEQLEESRILCNVKTAFERAFSESRVFCDHARVTATYATIVANVINHPLNSDVERNPRRLRLEKLRRVLPLDALLQPLRALGFQERVGGSPAIHFLVLDDRPRTPEQPGTAALLEVAWNIVAAERARILAAADPRE